VSLTRTTMGHDLLTRHLVWASITYLPPSALWLTQMLLKYYVKLALRYV
jgi:hypothetical protein